MKIHSSHSDNHESLTNDSLVLLVNSIPPYRIPLFNALNKNFSSFCVIADKFVESDRSWIVEQELFDFEYIVQKSLSFSKSWKKDAGRDFHLSLSTIYYLFRKRPKNILTSELGLRTLFAVIYKKMNPSTNLVIWLTLSLQTERNRDNYRRFFRSFLIKHASSILTSGQSAKIYIETFLNSPPIHIAAQPIESRPYPELRQRPSQSMLRMLFVGSSSPRKNLLPTIYSLSNWCEATGNVVQLSIAGVREDEIASFERSALLDTHFLGFLQTNEMQSIYSSNEFLIFPSLEDEWGLVVNEAIENRLLVIGSNRSEAVNELVIDGKSGFIYDPYIPGSLEQALDNLQRVHSNDVQKAEFLNNATNLIRNKASIPNFILALRSALSEKRKLKREFDVIFSLPYLNTYRTKMFKQLNYLLQEKSLSMAVLGSSPVNDRKFAGDEDFAEFYFKTPIALFGFNKKKLRFHFLPKSIFKVDLLIIEHSIGNLDYFLVLLIRRILGKSTGLWGHGSNITSSSNFLKRILEKVMTRLSNFYLAYTSKSAERVLQLGYKRKPIHVFFNSSDTKTLMEVETKSKEESEKIKFRALVIASGTSGKNLDSLSKVLETVRSRFINFEILIVGGAVQRPNDLERQNAFRFIPHVDSLSLIGIAKEADFILSLGRIGLIATDSFALGLPIFGLRSGYHGPEAEYLNGSNSLLVESIGSLSDSIVEVYENPEILQQLKNGCRQSVNDYSVEKSSMIIFNALLKELSR